MLIIVLIIMSIPLIFGIIALIGFWIQDKMSEWKANKDFREYMREIKKLKWKDEDLT